MIERSDNKGYPAANLDRLVTPRKGFAGQFSGLDLPNLIQMLALNAFTGALRLQQGGDSGAIYLNGGEIVHAVCGEVTGVEGFSRILAWEGGEIRLEPEELAPVVTIDIPWQSLLIQAVARIEDTKGRTPSSEPAPSPRVPQAMETLLLHKLYSISRNWGGVINCLVYAVDKGEIVRPTVIPPKLREWADMFRVLFQRSLGLQILDGNPRPHMISVTLEKRTWILIPHNSHLMAMELERGVDPRDIQRRVKQTLSEGM